MTVSKVLFTKFISSQIQNITAGTICLERVELEPAEQYTVTSLNQTAEGKSVFVSIGRLQPQNSCQFLYCIKPVPALACDLKALKLANNIGKLDIVWRSSNLAERGRLQTSQLQRSVSQCSKSTQVVQIFSFAACGIWRSEVDGSRG